jgi:hypothetical protein
MNRWMDESYGHTQPIFLSHCKSIPYLTSVLLNPGYIWELLLEILDNAETQTELLEIYIPVLWGGYLKKKIQAQPGSRIYSTTRTVAEVRAPCSQINFFPRPRKMKLVPILNPAGAKHINWVSDPQSQVTVLNPATSVIAELYSQTYLEKSGA